MSPNHIEGGLEFMEAHTRALRWVVGMFAHWDWTPFQVAAAWRFFALREQGVLRAIAFHQSWGGWWGMSAVDAPAAIDAWRYVSPLGSMRHLEGEDAQIEALRRIDPNLNRGLLREERSCVLRRASEPFTGQTLEGFRPARSRDLAALEAYHAASPGPGRAPSSQELRRQIARGAVFVLEAGGEVAALAKAVPAGSHTYIRDVFTFPRFRRQGHGRRIMEGLLSVLASQGKDACLCVADGNDEALRLYQRMGFESWGRRTHLILQPGRGADRYADDRA